jgi:hypothetical protein
MKLDTFGKDPEAFLRYTMAQGLSSDLKLRLFQAGPGTFWTNMADKPSIILAQPTPMSPEKK